ncbi:MAG: Hpt domain-containing protein [Robiginitomaculum sp.]|nr:Hpt domain-containing protein [Robiginitomaculum sp.]
MAKVDLKAIARAEEALESLSSNFDEWIVIELTKLIDARKSLPNNNMTGVEGRELFNRAHDLKGLGTTYGYPIVTAFASSLCDITGTKEVRAKAPIALVDAHIDSIRAAIKGSIKVTNHPIGGILSAELAKKTKQFLATI